MILTYLNKLVDFIKSHKKIVIISSAATLAVAVLVTALCLFLPVMSRDAISNTAILLFGDSGEFIEMIDNLNRKGFRSETELNMPAEITGFNNDVKISSVSLGQGKEEKAKALSEYTINVFKAEHKFSLGYMNESVYVMGTDSEGEEIKVYIPTSDILGSINNSIFSPESGSKFAMHQATYDILEKQFEKDDEDYEEEFSDLIEGIGERVSEIIKQNTVLNYGE